MDLEKEIDSLKNKISELEKQLNKDSKHFGKSYSTLGSSDSDVLIKTRGQIKLQWGSKFIDLLDQNGNIKTDSKFIYKQSELGNKDGIYALDNGDVILLIDGKEIKLINEGSSYVSFQKDQKSTKDEKHNALQNIGFIYDSISDLNEEALKNGIVYIEKENKLYIIKDGTFSEYLVNQFNSFDGQFIIEKKNSKTGSLIIRGEGIKNSLRFDSMNVYSENSGITFSNSNLDLILNIQDICIYSSVPIISNTFKSVGFNYSSGFELTNSNTGSQLTVDKINVKEPIIPIGTVVEYYGDPDLLSDEWIPLTKDYVNENGNTFENFILKSFNTCERVSRITETGNENGIYILKIK